MSQGLRQDPEVQVFVDKDDFQENNQIEANKEVHKDFGKVPKYLAKYNKEAETLAQQRQAL